MSRPRVLLADDHRIVVEGLRSLLAEEFNLVSVVEDGRAMIDAAKKLQPDIIVADIAMPRLNGIDAFIQLRKDMPRMKAVFLTMHQEIAYARRALEAGASGFVLKHAAPSELILAIRTALSGNVYITPSLTGEILHAMRTGPNASDQPATQLTSRQREILQLLAEGRSAKEIATSLEISARTVEFHKYHMMEVLGLRNNAALIMFAVKHGLVSA
ncbi:MAG TPA: response regulator transcription factor [Phycisphaerae bacterium]|nr:response regulator transcription factor [Phycisphaerae bacterium]